MCGRYVSPDEAAIEREFNLVHSEWQFSLSFNVAPTQNVPVIRSVDGKRQGALLRWGLIPFFARGIPPKYSTINARVETVQTAASYRGPWNRRREAWLNGSPEEAWEALTPYPDDLMVAWRVSARVNTPKNNDGALIEPV
jgi:putative SOS response-associated peptidase YedK